MNSEIVSKILQYVTDEFVEVGNRKTHESSCMFPWESCSCRDREAISIDTPLISGGYVDSFSMVSIVVFLEKEFNITVPESEIVPTNFNSIQKIAELVEKLKK
jgi:acyl carrier protein